MASESFDRRVAIFNLARSAGWPVAVTGCEALAEIVEEREKEAPKESR